MSNRSQNPKNTPRLAREAAALRANLAKRKAQSRERASVPKGSPAPIGAPGGKRREDERVDRADGTQQPCSKPGTQAGNASECFVQADEI